MVTVLVEGEVTPTQHPLVAKYAYLVPPGAEVRIQFGTDTNYGRETWTQSAPEGSSEVDTLVAGMRADTLYALFDNGNLRVLDASGSVCGSTTPCHSRAVNFHIDENARTAALSWVDILKEFSSFGGSARLLPNGNMEFDESAGPTPGPNAAVFEVTRTSAPETVWQLQVLDEYAYRVFRIPSLYPGVNW